MKRTLYFLVSLLLISALFHSCKKEEFDETLLIGTWGTPSSPGTTGKAGILHYKFLSNHTGGSWDTADGLQESDAQLFEWRLEKSDLTIIHIMEMGGGRVPEYFTVTQLTATTLKVKDDFNVNITFTKVK